MKIYPNDTCPCGSGKKFKKCCMNKFAEVCSFKSVPIDLDIRKVAFETPNEIVTEKFLDACESDVLQTIEHIEEEFNTKLVADRSFLPRLRFDLAGKPMGFALHFVSTWETEMMKRYVKSNG